MIDLTQIYGNNIEPEALFNIYLLIYISIVVLVILGIYFANKYTPIDIGTIPKLLIALVFVLLFYVGLIFTINLFSPDNNNQILRENIKAKYGLNILNDKISVLNSEDNIPSEKYYATFDDDNRVYEIYFIKDDDYLSLYSKNEKGVYLPLSALLGNVSTQTQSDVNNDNNSNVDVQSIE